MEYCLLGGKICATYTDGFPFWEIIVSGLVTLVVTAATIWASVYIAEKQTARQLAADRAAREQEQAAREAEAAAKRQVELRNERVELGALLIQFVYPTFTESPATRTPDSHAAWAIVGARFAAAQNPTASRIFRWAELLRLRQINRGQWEAAEPGLPLTEKVAWLTRGLTLPGTLTRWIAEPEHAVESMSVELAGLEATYERVQKAMMDELLRRVGETPVADIQRED